MPETIPRRFSLQWPYTMQNSDIPLKPLSSKPMKLSAIRPNPTNPRLIKEERFKALVRSLEHLPDFSAVNALKLDENNQIVGGNMRFKANDWDATELNTWGCKVWNPEEEKEEPEEKLKCDLCGK